VKVFIIAGEPSGDRLGAALMVGLKTLVPDVAFTGVGGDAMADEGLKSRFPMSELSIMGLAEVLPKYKALKARIAQTATAVIAAAPDVLITIDSPDFCLRVAKLVRAKLPTQATVHYVAPSVWAWRPGRAAKMAPVINHVLALLPFEPPYMQAAGMSCDFVGHPVVAEQKTSLAEAAIFRVTQGISPDAPLIVVLPGSRKGEISRLAPRFGAALAEVAAQRPDLRVVVPTVRAQADLVRASVADWPGRPLVLDPAQSGPAEKRAAFTAANAALAASGTVSLELAASATPMVIAYDFNWLSRTLLTRLVKLDTVTLVNLVSQTRAVPEFLGKACRPGPIAAALVDVLDNPDSRAAQLAAMSLTMQRLGQGAEAPGLRAAQSVCAFLARRT
jgi:lipid-A-disaccharide synthase